MRQFVKKINDFLKEQRLRWFRYIKRMNDERTLIKSKIFVGDGQKNARPKKRWKEVIDKDMLASGLKSDVQDSAG